MRAHFADDEVATVVADANHAYIKAEEKRIFYWPQNQVCGQCVHKRCLSLEDLQQEGLFQGVDGDDPTTWNAEDEPLLFHASKCQIGKSPDQDCLSETQLK